MRSDWKRRLWAAERFSGRLFATKLLLEAPPSAFAPSPKVQSAMLMFTPLKNPPPWSPTAEKVLRAAFQSRRKNAG